jgi:succinoglycan biosynthesis protein ExoA
MPQKSPAVPHYQRMRISVIIPCRNEENHIRGFLDSLLAQELDPGWELEILVADGMSDDGTREQLRQYAVSHPNIRVIDNPGRIVSTGLNAAIAASTGEVVIRMDGHTIYARDYIRQCVRVLEETGADNVGGPWVAEGRGTIGRAIAAAFRSRFCAGGGRAHDPKYEGEVDTVYLGCWKRSVFDRAGLFDPNLVRNQDDEFNFRLKRLGGRIWQSPAIHSIYTPRGSLKALFRQYSQYGFWKVAVIRKHAAVASWRHAVPVLFVLSIILGLATGGLAALIGGVSAARIVAGLLGLELTVYAAACVAASLEFARSLPLRSLAAVPVVIAMYHAAYGLGFLVGMLRPVHAGSGKAPPQRFSALTR